MPFWFGMVVLAEGLIIGAMAPNVAPERDSVSFPGSVFLSLVGAYLGGVIAWLFTNTAAGVLFAAIGAIALVYTRRRFTAG